MGYLQKNAEENINEMDSDKIKAFILLLWQNTFDRPIFYNLLHPTSKT